MLEESQFYSETSDKSFAQGLKELVKRRPSRAVAYDRPTENGGNYAVEGIQLFYFC
jgi:hypothetical protein